jgi:peptide/nickel transport system ATP-binding protein
MADTILEVNHLTVRYESEAFQKNPRLHGREGRLLHARARRGPRLSGESGCGKSTLSKAILGMLPYEGEIIHYTKRRRWSSRTPTAA